MVFAFGPCISGCRQAGGSTRTLLTRCKLFKTVKISSIGCPISPDRPCASSMSAYECFTAFGSFTAFGEFDIPYAFISVGVPKLVVLQSA